MIEIRDLHKAFFPGFRRKRVDALRGVTLDVRPGDLYGFIGPNGAGKSTTIKILLGLLRPGSGTALLMGKPAGRTDSRRDVGFLPEQPYFYDYLSGAEFLGFYGRLAGLKGAGLKQRVAETAELVGIRDEWMGRRLRTFSKGMLQRMGLAQALVGRPRLVILDEPMSGLDPMGRRDIRNLLQKLHRDGMTVCYSSHVLGDVEAICTRLAMIVDGQIRRQGTVAEVLEGEEAGYQVVLAREVDLPAPPKGCQAVNRSTFLCRDAAGKTELLKWALAAGAEVESVQRIRHTLEDVLAGELGRAH